MKRPSRLWTLVWLTLLVGPVDAHGTLSLGAQAKPATPLHTKKAPPQLVSELAALLDGGQLANAKTRVEDAVKQYPSDAALHNIAGAIDAQQGQYESAQRHFRSAIQSEPGDAAAYLNLGRLYQERAKDDPEASANALAVYRQLLRVEPAHPEALFQAAYLSACQGEWTAAHGFVEQMPDATRSRPQVLAVMAVTLTALDDPVRAQKAINDLLAHPDLAEEDVLAVRPALDRLRNDALSARLLQGLDTRHLASAPSLQQLAAIELRQSRFEIARGLLERAVTASGAPTPEMLLDLARVAYKQKDFQGTLGYLAHARELDPNNAEVHFFFGIACIELNLGGEAYDALKKAVALAPDNPYVNYALGAVSIHRHESSEALPYFEKYVHLRPRDPRGRFALGVARFYSNDFEGARTDFSEAARSPETSAGAHYFLGRIARQSNQLDAARDEIDRALTINPNYADALAELGLLLTRREEYAAAEQTLSRALTIDPDNYAATLNLAALFNRTRDPRREEQAARLAALQEKRATAAQEFLRIVQVVR